MLVSFLIAAWAAPQQPPAYDPSRSFAPLVEAVSKAVVKVEEADAALPSTRTGSGFLISDDGLVLTNHHVAEVFSQIQLRTQDGAVHPAKIIGTDAAMDIALLQISGPTPWLAMADMKGLRVGDRVLTLGSPLGLGLTATAGIISGLGRNLGQDRFYGTDDFIQTDAAINQGNSGGPLFDLDGRVVGMASAIMDNVNTVGFAIPADQLAFAVKELRAHGRIRRGFMGVKAAPLSDEGASDRGILGGAVIKEVVKKSPAARAGLKPGDVVTHVAGSAVISDHALMATAGNRKPGTVVKLTVLRNTETLTLKLILGDLK